MTESARQGLDGVAVLVTRPAHQAAGSLAQVAAAGGRPVPCPVFEIDWQGGEAEAGRLARLRDDDWLVASSPNAVAGLVRLLRRFDLSLPAVRFAAVGEATAAALAAEGWAVAATPASGEGAGALLEAAAFADLSGRRVALCRGAGGRRVLDRALPERGAEVLPLTVYRRRVTGPDPEAIREWLATGSARIILLTSATSVEGLLTGLDATTVAAVRQCPVVGASERVLKKAGRAGFSGALIQASHAGDEAMVAAALHWWQQNRNQA